MYKCEFPGYFESWRGRGKARSEKKQALGFQE
jgi:hypothetical protein